jgi:hypothetical protein
MPKGPDNPTLLAKKKAEAGSLPAENAFATSGRSTYNGQKHVSLGFN